MSAATKASTPPPIKKKSFFESWTFPAAFIGVGVLIALLFGYLQATVVTGAEFDTGSWTVRTFWYRRDPFTGRQITGILRELPATLCSTPAFPNSYFSGASSKPARWDLVKLQSGTTMTEGPAYVLKSYLQGSFADQLWPTWSKDNPVKAKTLWPAVRDLVDLELYHELPRIMELAKIDSTDAEFTTIIYSEMKSILIAKIDRLRVAENADELAVVKAILSNYSVTADN